MTNGITLASESQAHHPCLSIGTVPLKIVKPDDENTIYNRDGTSSDSEPSPKGTPDIIPKHLPISSLTRQVSHDGLASCSNSQAELDEKQPASNSGRSSPMQHVSEIDNSIERTQLDDKKIHGNQVPLQPNPLRNRGILMQHTHSLRLEASLHPLRLILSRLMTNLTYNRKGIFNYPVDPIALGLSDYFQVIQVPMDLGTVKNRLHSLAYNSRLEVVEDIRLCFRNAMKYNPPQNTIHISAKELLKYFEDQLSSFCPELADFTLLNQDETHSNVRSEYSIESLHEERLPASALPESRIDLSSPYANTINTNPSQSVVTANVETSEKRSIDETIAVTKKRKKRGSKVNSGHCCQWCNGSVCSICEQGCLQLQPTLLICNGPQCVGAKIRKGATYFTCSDGSYQYCQRCYVGLPAVLPGNHEDWNACRYKRNLLRRKNDEETVEQWLTCGICEVAVHQMCAMHNPYVHASENYVCPSCHLNVDDTPSDEHHFTPPHSSEDDTYTEMYTFVTGKDLPVPLSDVVTSSSSGPGNIMLTANSLPENPVSCFIEQKVRQRLCSPDYPNAEKTIVIRVISECERFFKVPDIVRKHFRLQSSRVNGTGIVPPSKVTYRSKAIALFQKFDGLDVCIFCMYVQEYNGNDDFETDQDKLNASQEKRVYIAYLDSVEHFRPRTLRTVVYQEVLTAYLATARLRGYETAHIWACPPSRGNSFVFWNHPTAQRTPNMERLTAWYNSAIGRAIGCGVVTDVRSLYESDFEEALRRIEETSSDNCNMPHEMLCPPLLEGDFWIEEALRVHNVTFSRLLKEISSPPTDCSSESNEISDPCPAIQVSAMFREKIIMHPLSKAFRRPVNAAAMNLNDYHTIIVRPMDLGTVLTRCVLGEYETLSDLVADVNLVFANAKKFNPPGHIVHTNAVALNEIFFMELNNVTETWLDSDTKRDAKHSWENFASMSMSLCERLNHFYGSTCKEGKSFSKNITSGTSDQCKFGEPTSKAMHVDGLQSDGTYDPPETVRRQMVGRDVWLLSKKNALLPKTMGLMKNSKRGRKSTVDSVDEPVLKRRRQTWLGEEVGAAMRRMRTSFFKCSLTKSDVYSSINTKKYIDAFQEYAGDYQMNDESTLFSSRVADARHSFLEVSQFRSLEFDTLRRAKYSSAILLYHLHYEGAPGLIPKCSTCGMEIEGVRWHRICKVIEARVSLSTQNIGRKPKASLPFIPEELCLSCYSKHSHQNQFIPLQVSL